MTVLKAFAESCDMGARKLPAAPALWSGQLLVARLPFSINTYMQ